MSRIPLSDLPLRAARWSATHPWRAIGGWLVFVALAVALAATVTTQRVAEADYRVGESGRGAAMLDDAGLNPPPTELVLIAARGDRLDAEDAGAAARGIATGMSELDAVAGVGEAIPSADQKSLLVPVELTSDDVDAGPLLAVTASVQESYPELVVEQAGQASIGAAIDERVARDLHTAEFISLPITLLLMLLAFGALIAAGLPVLLAATSVAATIGLTALVSYLVPAEPTVYSMIVLIGMAVGVDYSLFYLKRERQERAAGRTHLDAVAIAAETSGHAILVSGAAVIASLAGLFVLTDVTFNSLATGSILVVAVAVLGSITVLPALLAKLGRWVDRPRVPLLWRLTGRTDRLRAGRLLDLVVRRPVAALVVSAVVIALLAVPAWSLKTHRSSVETLPDDLAVVQTYRAIAKAFPSEGTSARVVVAGAEHAPAEAALSDLAAEAMASGDFVAAAPVRVSDDGATSVLDLALPYDESDERSAAAIERLRADLLPDALGGLDHAEWAVAGDAAASLDYTDKLRERMPFLIGFVLALTMLMMVAAFRSVRLGLVSTVLNLASVGVAFGVLVLVFQRGYGESLLGFTSPGFLIDWIPIFVLVVLVGLSMDYHVFVLSRIRELVDQGVGAREAVRRGVGDTAGVITSAAAVMVSVFAIFATLSMVEMKMLGVGLSAAILIDATLIRLVVLPAVLVLLGERAWPHRRRPVGEPARAAPAPGLAVSQL